MDLRPIDTSTEALYDRIDNRYTAHETISIQYSDDSGFSLSFTSLRSPVLRTYPDDSVHTAQELIRRTDAECFFVWMDGQLVGQAVVTADWNKIANLWDIRVEESARGKGVGKALIDACLQWARQQGLKGLSAETQSLNPSACRFYQKKGFTLGGVDRLLYAGIQQQAAGPAHPVEYALFFYILF